MVIVPAGSGAAAGPGVVVVLVRTEEAAGDEVCDDTGAEDALGVDCDVPLVHETTASIDPIAVETTTAVPNPDLTTRTSIQ